MKRNVTQKLIVAHAPGIAPAPGDELDLRIDQTLTQDATGTMVMLELEAMGLYRVRTGLSVQYVDHNLVQADNKNPDDHIFLRSAALRFGLWFSGPGNGVSHPLHQERFGVPGATLLGSDSHTPAAGAIGMLAIGAGGIEVAAAMAGQPYRMNMPGVLGVRLEGELPPGVSAKDVILEMLRRRGVKGALNTIVEYHGPGLNCLSTMDRHVIANMGTEMGATTSVFPSDDEVHRFLRTQGRASDWRDIRADPGAGYDEEEIMDLSGLVPLIALPSSPDRVVPVAQVAGKPIYQAYIGSSANPGYRDFAVAARIVHGKRVHPAVSFDVNPTTRGILQALASDGSLFDLIRAGARLHQTGCNGCIGMGQAPATGRLSLRTVPRNFPGRSGTRDDKVCLVSPETAAASALRGEITDPRSLEGSWEKVRGPGSAAGDAAPFEPPLPRDQAARVTLEKGPNIKSLPEFDPFPESLRIPVLLRAPDHISTDEILPAGMRVLPYRSNIEKISAFAFEAVDPNYAKRAKATVADGGHAVVGGENYGQGSSREHAVLAPRHLGLRVVLARSFARIHHRNLINFGVVPLIIDPEVAARLDTGQTLAFHNLIGAMRRAERVEFSNGGRGTALHARHDCGRSQLDTLAAGGMMNLLRAASFG